MLRHPEALIHIFSHKVEQSIVGFVTLATKSSLLWDTTTTLPF